jgi:hypothetical protein
LGSVGAVSPQLGTLTPAIEIEPSANVEIGELVLFDASSTTYVGSGDVARARYEWDMGDDYVVKYGDPYYYSADGGIAVTHLYMRPGTFTVTLTVSLWENFEGDGDPIGSPVDVATATTHVTVSGQPPRLPPWPAASTRLDMALDGDLADSSANHLSASWQDGTGSFVQGKAGQAARLDGARYISVADPAGVLDGLAQFTLSFWAKKNAKADYGCLVDKPGQFRVTISSGGTLQVNLTTVNGSDTTSVYNVWEVDNVHWHHYAITYDGGTVRVFVDGRERVSQARTGALAASTDSLLLGKRASAPAVFNGLVDEVRIYAEALSTREVSTAFELWHAPYHGRIAQYIYAQIPGAVYANPTNKLHVTVAGDNGYSAVLVDKATLAAEEKFLLRNENLPAGNYTLTAQLLDAGGAVLDEIREKFAKPYAGRPRVGIDENNAYIVDGQPFFAMMPWMVDEDKMDVWRPYLNGGTVVGYYPEDNVDTWTQYLDAAQKRGLVIVGPVEWEGAGVRYYTRNWDMSQLEAYVNATKNHPALFGWGWGDEQNMGNYLQRNPAQAMDAWTYKCHQLDPQHLVAPSQYGHRYLPYYGFPDVMQRPYNYLFSADSFGGKKHFIFDTFMFDVYPLEFHYNPALAEPDRGMYAAYATAMDYARDQNYDLVPVMSSVEGVNISETDAQYPMPSPTPGQVRMMAWMHVVHGIKGVNWFLYREALRPPENLGVMAEFADQITHYAPIVLGPPASRTLTDTANARGRMVDTMIRETEDSIYVFAVRVTEPDFEQDRDGQPREAQSIDVSFEVGGLEGQWDAAEVFGQFETVCEDHGSAGGGTSFNFTLDQAPIKPGSLIVHGLWPQRPDRPVWIPVFDRGNGIISGTIFGTVDAAGTVDYQTGQVSLTFEEVITPGTAGIRVTYTPVRPDRVIPMVNGRFQDSFAREQVRIYKIPRNLVSLELRGTGGNQTIYLDWTVGGTLPPTSTWLIEYQSWTGTAYLPIVGIPGPTRAYTLTGLTNGAWYTVTLSAVGVVPPLTASVRVMPSGIMVYLPLILKN